MYKRKLDELAHRLALNFKELGYDAKLIDRTGARDAWNLLNENGTKVMSFRFNGCLLYTSPSPRDS